jgi:hypothetical protein
MNLAFESRVSMILPWHPIPGTIVPDKADTDTGYDVIKKQSSQYHLVTFYRLILHIC